mmetsp:Transcript_35992/g.107517  ORF Transcript_35992/g.107517 Transcript_35992/m.107517 type:complete len:206 (+) Transcript_35992:454-1071(+)
MAQRTAATCLQWPRNRQLHSPRAQEGTPNPAAESVGRGEGGLRRTTCSDGPPSGLRISKSRSPPGATGDLLPVEAPPERTGELGAAPARSRTAPPSKSCRPAVEMSCPKAFRDVRALTVRARRGWGAAEGAASVPGLPAAPRPSRLGSRRRRRFCVGALAPSSARAGEEGAAAPLPPGGAWASEVLAGRRSRASSCCKHRSALVT